MFEFDVPCEQGLGSGCLCPGKPCQKLLLPWSIFSYAVPAPFGGSSMVCWTPTAAATCTVGRTTLLGLFQAPSDSSSRMTGARGNSVVHELLNHKTRVFLQQVLRFAPQPHRFSITKAKLLRQAPSFARKLGSLSNKRLPDFGFLGMYLEPLRFWLQASQTSQRNNPSTYFLHETRCCHPMQNNRQPAP